MTKVIYYNTDNTKQPDIAIQNTAKVNAAEANTDSEKLITSMNDKVAAGQTVSEDEKNQLRVMQKQAQVAANQNALDRWIYGDEGKAKIEAQNKELNQFIDQNNKDWQTNANNNGNWSGVDNQLTQWNTENTQFTSQEISNFNKISDLYQWNLENFYSSDDFKNLTAWQQAKFKAIAQQQKTSPDLNPDTTTKINQALQNNSNTKTQQFQEDFWTNLENIARITSNLNTLKQSNPEMFATRADYEKNFNYAWRSQQEKNLLDNFWQWQQNNLSSNDILGMLQSWQKITNGNVLKSDAYKTAVYAYNQYSALKTKTSNDISNDIVKWVTSVDNPWMQILATQDPTKYSDILTKVSNKNEMAWVSSNAESTYKLYNWEKVTTDNLKDMSDARNTLLKEIMETVLKNQNLWQEALTKYKAALDDPSLKQQNTELTNLKWQIDDLDDQINQVATDVRSETSSGINESQVNAIISDRTASLMRQKNSLTISYNTLASQINNAYSRIQSDYQIDLQQANLDQQYNSNVLWVMEFNYNALNSDYEYERNKQDTLEAADTEFQREIQKMVIQKNITLDTTKKTLELQDLYTNWDINSSDEKLVKKAIQKWVESSMAIYTNKGWKDWTRTPEQITDAIYEWMKSWQYTSLSDWVNNEIVNNVQSNPGYQQLIKYSKSLMTVWTTDLVKDEDWNRMWVDKANKTMSYVNPTGWSSSASITYNGQTLSRTDRNNNLIAAAVWTNWTNQYTKALDDAGISWSYGDTFSNWKMSTIKIEWWTTEAMAASKAILWWSNAIQSRYSNRSRWSKVNQEAGTNVKTQSDFNKLSDEKQEALIKAIYQKWEWWTGYLLDSKAQTASQSSYNPNYASAYEDYLKTWNLPTWMKLWTKKADEFASQATAYQKDKAGQDTSSSSINDADIAVFNSLTNTDRNKYRTDPTYQKFIEEQKKVFTDPDANINDIAKYSAWWKDIWESMLTSLTKFWQALSQIWDLSKKIESEDTWPIMWAIRSYNPWDSNAQALKAEINALIPNLARWVYGEVWVLTDNDIENYSKTVPNIKSTADTNKLILAMTLKSMMNWYKNILQTQAAGWRDVSQFVWSYTTYEDKINSLLSSIWWGTNATWDNSNLTSIWSSAWETNLNKYRLK